MKRPRPAKLTRGHRRWSAHDVIFERCCSTDSRRSCFSRHLDRVRSSPSSSNGYNGKERMERRCHRRQEDAAQSRNLWQKPRDDSGGSRNSVFTAEHFEALPANPFCDDMRRLIKSGLGQANPARRRVLRSSGCERARLLEGRDRPRQGRVARRRRFALRRSSPLQRATSSTFPRQRPTLRRVREEFIRVVLIAPGAVRSVHGDPV